jgi:hypothetical protein
LTDPEITSRVWIVKEDGTKVPFDRKLLGETPLPDPYVDPFEYGRRFVLARVDWLASLRQDGVRSEAVALIHYYLGTEVGRLGLTGEQSVAILEGAKEATRNAIQ